MIEIRDTFDELTHRVARRLRSGTAFPKTYARFLILGWLARRWAR